MKTISEVLESYIYEVDPKARLTTAKRQLPWGDYMVAHSLCDSSDAFSVGTGMNLAGLRLAEREYDARWKATVQRLSELFEEMEELDRMRKQVQKAIDHKLEYLTQVIEPQYNLISSRLRDLEESLGKEDDNDND